MDLLKLFRSHKPSKVREIFSPVMGNLWLVMLNFTPWNREKYSVVIEEVGVESANVDNQGIYIRCNKRGESREPIYGYLDKISSTMNGWTGFFESKEKAVEAYNKLIDDWVEVITSNKLN